VSLAAITLCVDSQRVFVVVWLSTQSGNFWIHSRTNEVHASAMCHTKSVSTGMFNNIIRV
jgi:hypothetical protein